MGVQRVSSKIVLMLCLRWGDLAFLGSPSYHCSEIFTLPTLGECVDVCVFSVWVYGTV